VCFHWSELHLLLWQIRDRPRGNEDAQKRTCAGMVLIARYFTARLPPPGIWHSIERCCRIRRLSADTTKNSDLPPKIFGPIENHAVKLTEVLKRYCCGSALSTPFLLCIASKRG